MFSVSLTADNTINELFHSAISPAEIIPPDAIAINDADGEILRVSGSFADYALIDGVVVLK